MKTVKVTCDNCGNDITYTGNSVDYRVAVLNQRLRPYFGEDQWAAVTDMMIYPPLPDGRDQYFCDLRCLRESPLITGEKDAQA